MGFSPCEMLFDHFTRRPPFFAANLTPKKECNLAASSGHSRTVTEIAANQNALRATWVFFSIYPA